MRLELSTFDETEIDYHSCPLLRVVNTIYFFPLVILITLIEHLRMSNQARNVQVLDEHHNPTFYHLNNTIHKFTQAYPKYINHCPSILRELSKHESILLHFHDNLRTFWGNLLSYALREQLSFSNYTPHPTLFKFMCHRAKN